MIFIIVYNKNMNVRIEIDTKTFVRFWLVVIGFALAILAIYSARTALIIVCISIFLALALSPIVNKFTRVLSDKKSRILGTAIAYLAVVVALGAIIFLVVPPIVDQTAKFMQNVPNLIDSASKQSAALQNFIDRYDLQPQVDQAITAIKSSSLNFASDFGSNILSGVSSILSFITSVILVFVLTFLMLIEGPTWMNRLWSLYKNKTRMQHHRRVITDMYKTVTSYIIGQLTVSAIAGSVAGLFVFILSLTTNIPISLAIPTAAIVFVLSLIPMFGAMLGACIITLVLMLSNVTAALIFLLFFILYQQVEANFISPKIQSKRLNLSALVILIAVTVGVYLFGILGGIISVPVAGCIKIIIDDYLKNRRFTATKTKKKK